MTIEGLLTLMHSAQVMEWEASLRQWVAGFFLIIVYHIIYSFNVKLTSATFNNATTRYIINLNLKKTCKWKQLIVCPKAKNNFNEIYFENYRYRQNK